MQVSLNLANLTKEKPIELGTPRNLQTIMTTPFSFDCSTVINGEYWLISKKYFTPEVLPRIAEFLASEKCPFKALCFDECHFDTDTLEHWFRLINKNENIKVLELKNSLLDDETCIAMHTGLTMNKSLKTVKLVNMRISQEGINSISDGAYASIRPLQKLIFKGCHHSPRQHQLINAELYSLEELNEKISPENKETQWRIDDKLIHRDMQKKIINIYFASAKCPVQSLSIVGGYMAHKQLNAMLNGVKKSKITSLHFEKMDLRRESFSTIGESLIKLFDLTELHFANIRIGKNLAELAKGICPNSEGVFPLKLRKVSLESCHLNGDCSKFIWQIVKESYLEELVLSSNSLGSKTMPVLRQSKSFSKKADSNINVKPLFHQKLPATRLDSTKKGLTLAPIQESQSLPFGNPDYASSVIKKIASAWPYTRLRRLDLSDTNLGSADLAALKEAVRIRNKKFHKERTQKHQTIQNLINSLDRDGKTLITVLEENMLSLKKSDSTYNESKILQKNIDFTKDCYEAILGSLNEKLKKLNAENNKFKSSQKFNPDCTIQSNFESFPYSSIINVGGNGFDKLINHSNLTNVSPRSRREAPKIRIQRSSSITLTKPPGKKTAQNKTEKNEEQHLESMPVSKESKTITTKSDKTTQNDNNDNNDAKRQ